MFRAVRLNATSYPVEDAEVRALRAVGAELVSVEGQHASEIVAAAAECDALLVVSSRVPGDVIRQLTRCRIISRLGAGTDRIDVDAATQLGIVVANVPDFCLNEQAEHTMALLLASCRRLPYMIDAMHRGEWTARSHSGVHRLAGQTLGLIGFGASAQAVARRAAAFDVRVIAWTRAPDKYREQADKLGVAFIPMERLFADADFVSIHVPLTDETRGLVNASRLKLMKPSGILINTARGAIVDEAALVEALRNRQIGGAALDVFDGIDVFALPQHGTSPSHPLLELENVILTPHCAGSSVESTLDSKTRGAQHAAQVLKGHWPTHVVNPNVSPRLRLAHHQ